MIIRPATQADIPALHKLWQQAFGDPDDAIFAFFRTGFSEDRCMCLCTPQLAAALYWFDCQWQGEKIAYIYAVATDQAFRGQGLCRQLMDCTHRHLQQADYAGAILVPAEQGLFTLYEKLGYTACCNMRQCSAEATGAIAAQQISAATYKALRPTFLPEGAVLQDTIALSYLETYAKFYRWEQGICCGTIDGSTLHIQEILGPPDHAAGLAAGLDCKDVRFRAPGGNDPYAMYRSFSANLALPAYFGIPLD